MSGVHGGTYSDKCDFSANINPLGLHPAAQGTISSLALRTKTLSRYPESNCAELRRLLAEFYAFPQEHIVCGAGASDILFSLVQSWCAHRDAADVVVVEPAFTEYERAAKLNGCSVRHFLLSENNSFAFAQSDMARLAENLDGAGMLFLASPSNPAGVVLSGDELCQIATLCEEKNVLFVADACFSQFSSEAEQGIRTLLSRRTDFPHTVVLNAFTKFYGMAGLRLGYALCFSEEIARCIFEAMRPWAVGSAELATGCAVMSAELAEKNALKNNSSQTVRTDWEKQTHTFVQDERKRLASALQGAGFFVVPGEANFILFRADDTDLAEKLLEKNIAIRSCADFYGLDTHWYRIAVRSKNENDLLINALSTENLQSLHPHAAVLMIQGTMSNAGKSLLVAALCRIFKQDGYRVAPFKSQNMALNSGVTADGLEMGRAQIMQAEAAGLLPDVRMNPVLLKPTGERTSQVIVQGLPTKTMDAREYFAFRHTLIPQILEAYHSLAEENDIIVLEGAGSPAEINLKKDDIVNMGLAELVDAPVLLAGDIDRGGVFASLYGTAALVTEQERARIKGFVINKFRGDVSLLQDGLNQIRDLTGIPVVGVVPFIPDLLLDDEDSLSSQLTGEGHGQDQPKQDALLHIAVVRLPYISNFTDIQAFSRLPFVQVSFFDSFDSYAEAVNEYGEPDLFVLPGTKNSVHALQWLRETHLDKLIVRKAKSGFPTIGICGGFQLLGTALHDADGNEDASAQETIPALNLLPAETSFTSEKTRVQVQSKLPNIDGVFSPLTGCFARGYEIHHGKTQFVSGREAELSAQKMSNKAERAPLVFVKNNVLGTYIHGFFDSDEITRALITLLCERKSIPVPSYQSYQNERDKSYDRLADVVRKSLDMDAIYKIVFGEKL
ncbi:MAG: cobyric acid synthase [Treponema sp.]|nr:cobyric acid synthase [Treponema sp.]